MKLTYDSRLLSSFLLFLDHTILKKGEAFFNVSGQLYPVNSPYNGLYAYAAPYRSWVNDTSIPNATIISGVYLNGTLVNIPTSGLRSINHNDGTVYFTGQMPSNITVSGRYAVKEINTQITDLWEMKILFETKFVNNSKFDQALSGLSSDAKTVPALFLRYKEGENKPFAFGGLDDNSVSVRGVLICDSEIQKIGVCNILKNLNLSGFGYVTGGLPFDFRGSYTGLPYNYDSLPFDTTYQPFVHKVRAYDVPQKGEYSAISKSMAIIDFELFTAMRHNT